MFRTVARRRAHMRIVVGFLAFTVLAACRPEQPAGAPADARREVGGALELTATVSTSELRVGERATLTLALRNPADTTATLVFGDGCQLLAYIENEQGSPVYPQGGWGCITVITTLVLPPHATQAREVVLHGGAPAQAIHSGAILPPGRYRAYGTLGLAPSDRLRSDTVRFTVVE